MKIKKILMTVSIAGALTFSLFGFNNTTEEAGCYGYYSNGMEIVRCE